MSAEAIRTLLLFGADRTVADAYGRLPVDVLPGAMGAGMGVNTHGQTRDGRLSYQNGMDAGPGSGSGSGGGNSSSSGGNSSSSGGSSGGPSPPNEYTGRGSTDS